MITPWVGRLLVANVIVFLLQVFYPYLTVELLLVPSQLLRRPWTAVTYMFLHGSFMHLAVNMFGLYFLGPRLEVWLGSRRFLGLYFLSGLAAAVVSVVFTPEARIVGASGAVFGILLAFAHYWPRERLWIWGVLPLETRWLVGLLVASSLFFGFSGGQAGVAHFAHLGGLAGGWAYVRFVDRRRSAGSESGLAEKVTGALKRETVDRRAMERWEAVDPGSLHEVNREYFEELREKLEQEGPSSLSVREREFLDRMAARSEPDD